MHSPPLRSFLILLLVFSAGVRGDELAQSRRTAVVRAVERVQPAVVSVHVTHLETVYKPYRDPYRDPFFDMFFPRFHREERESSPNTGSGFVVNREGYILTNAHVIGEDPHHIAVSLSGGRTLEARHLGSDVYFDLAILKVDERDLPVASLGDSDDILVGEWAIAIGNPFDLGTTVNVGVISAVDRDFPEPQGDFYYRDMIQTDAPINPGNSGGPLVNALGEVIGINTFIFTGGGYSIGSIGIGFAIPINAAQRFLDEIKQHGRVRRPWTGIAFLQDLTPTLARSLKYPSTEGAIVVRVDRGGPAERSGLRRGDVIAAINGAKIADADEAIGVLSGFRVDEECILSVYRDGEEHQVHLHLAEWPRSGRGWR